MIGAAGLAKADSLGFTVTPAGVDYQYSFTLSNTGTTGGTLFDLYLTLPEPIGGIDTANIGTPVGWGDSSGGFMVYGPYLDPSSSLIEWSSDFSGAYDVVPGHSLSGFSFLSSQRLSQSMPFSLNGSAGFANAQEIPEPSTLLLLPILAAAAWVRRRRTQP